MKSERSKMLHQVAGVPLCCWPIGRVCGVVDGSVVAVIGFQGDAVQQVVSERFGSRVSFAWQYEQNGTGDAVRLALAEIPLGVSTVLVSCGDTPLLKEESLRALLQAQVRCEAKIAFFAAIHDSPTGYGRVIRDSNGFVTRIIEEADASDEQRQIQEINSGIYVFDAAFLRSQIGDLQSNN